MREREQECVPEQPGHFGCLQYLEITAAIGVLASLSFGAFSRRTRDEIWNRAHGQSEVPDDTGDPETLMCGHFNHNKKSRDYDNPDNGCLWTKREEYLYHYESEGRNGLTIHDNRATLLGLWNELSRKDRRGLPKPRKI